MAEPILRKKFYLNTGEMVFSEVPVLVSADLRSSVVVSLFSKRFGAGGVVHYSHPGMIPDLIDALCGLTGESPDAFVATIVDGSRAERETADEAYACLSSYGVRILTFDIGDGRDREVLFNTATGRVHVTFPEGAAVSEASDPQSLVRLRSTHPLAKTCYRF